MPRRLSDSICILLAVCYCLFFFPLQLSAQDVSKYGGQLVLSTTSDPKSFNDILAKETSSGLITSILFEGLTTTDPFTLKVKPHLAERWEVSDDGLVWVFHLRRNVKWFDGEPFTADDVIFTFNELIFNPDIPNSARDIFTIDGEAFKVEKLDNYTVSFTLPVKFAPFLRGMSQAILPKHRLKKVLDEGKFNFTWGIDTDPGEIIGTGPFKLVRYIPGQKLILKRNPHYWKKSDEGGALPYLDEVIFLIVQNSDIELLKFLEGSLDELDLRGMDYSLVKPLEKERNFTIYDSGPNMGSNFIVFNLNTGINEKSQKPYVDPVKLSWFSNVEFRRAVAHAIDKQRIIEIIKNGLGYPQYSPMGPAAGFFYNPDVETYDYNLERARGILQKAGFVDRNHDGVIEDQKGNKIEFTLFTSGGANDERTGISAIIAHDLEKLGMKINFQTVEFNTLVSKLTSTYQWEAIVLGLTGGVEPHFGQNVWHSSGQLHMWHPKQESPATAWEKRIDELFSQGVQELDEDKRKKIYDEYQLIVSQQLPVIYTVLGANIVAVRNKFGNLKPSSFGVFHNLEEIYIKENLRP